MIPMPDPIAAAVVPPKRKPKAKSPTARSLEHLRDLGCPLVAVVEKWNPHAQIRQDLFGLIDVLAISAEGETIAVQCCSGSGGDAADRVRKITDSDKLPHMLNAKWRVVVHAWRKNAAGRWVLREVEL